MIYKDYTVEIKMVGKYFGTYQVKASTYYEAKKLALEVFLGENGIEGKSYQFLTTKRSLVEISIKSLKDGRRKG